MKYFTDLFKKHGLLIILTSLFLILIATHLYGSTTHFSFGSDQRDNFSAAKNIIENHNFPLVGMVAKGNSGFYIGPLYYYYVAFFYLIFGFHPETTIVIALVTSIITFFGLFIIFRKLFGKDIALISLYIFSTSSFIIFSDRVQWPVNFIVLLSCSIFYLLYTIIRGNTKNILWLAFVVGLSFQIHFTSVFYLLIIFLSLPFFPRRKDAAIYSIIAFAIFLLFVSPIALYNSQHKNAQVLNLTSYLSTYYHGFHFTRFFQLTHDGLIEFYAILQYKIVDILNFLFPLLFFYLYLRNNTFKKVQGFAFSAKIPDRIKLVYLICLWLLVPWFAFSLYKGEISNYYFAMTRPIVLFILALITYWLLKQKMRIIGICTVAFWLYFAFINLSRVFIQ